MIISNNITAVIITFLFLAFNACTSANQSTLTSLVSLKVDTTNNIKPFPVAKMRTRRLIVEDNVQLGYILFGEELINGDWNLSFDTIACNVGYNGIAAVGEKKEGDGKTPSGIFKIGDSFGYNTDTLGLKRVYLKLEDEHYWNSDSASPLYNTLVNGDPKDGISEKMLRKDHLYKYGLVIEYNIIPPTPQKGSAIFIHLQRKEKSPTAGCVSISDNNIIKLLVWLDADLHSFIWIRKAS